MSWPGSSLETLIWTGAPIARVRSLGCHALMNGTAVKPSPTPPTTLAVAVRKRRLPPLTPAVLMLRTFSSQKPGVDDGRLRPSWRGYPTDIRREGARCRW